MNEPFRKTPPTTGRGGSVKPLALLATVLVIGISLYASRVSPPSSATAVADEVKPAIPTDQRGGGGRRVPRRAGRQTAREGAVRVRQCEEIRLVQSPGDRCAAQRRTARRPDQGATDPGDGGRRRRSQQERLSEGRRYHGRRSTIGRGQGRRGQRRQGRWGAQGDVRCRPVFPGDLRQAVRDAAVDGAIRRPSPRPQCHRDRQAFRAHADAYRRAADALQTRRQGRASARAWKTTPRSSW